MNRAITARLTVIDGYRALIAGGPPHNGDPKITQLGTVLVGRDRVMIDIAGITLPSSEAIHATTPEKHPTIVAACMGGLWR